MTSFPAHNHHVDVLIIGGGLMGLSSAWSLRQRGFEVMILEATSLARHASSASAGGVRSLNRHRAEIALSRAALPLWGSLSRELGHACGFQVSGQMRIAENDAAVDALQKRADMTRDLGYTHERWINAAELHTRLPYVSRHCRGALIVDDDGFADPLATVHAYRQACIAKGIRLLEGICVESVYQKVSGVLVRGTITGNKAACVASTPDTHSTQCENPSVEYHCKFCINTAGAWGAELSALAGDHVPLTPVALQMAVTESLPPFVSEVVGCHGRKLSLKQTAAGAVVIGGGFQGAVQIDPICRLRGQLDQTLAAKNLGNAVALFPHLKDARVLRQWAGIEGVVSDGLPVLGPSKYIKGLVHAFGFSAHGFALVPVVGSLVADMVEGRNTNLPIEAFAVDRFTQPASTLSI